MLALVQARGLAQISDPAALEAIVDGVLAANPKQLLMFRGGKTKLQGFFVGCAPRGCSRFCFMLPVISVAQSKTPVRTLAS